MALPMVERWPRAAHGPRRRETTFAKLSLTYSQTVSSTISTSGRSSTPTAARSSRRSGRRGSARIALRPVSERVRRHERPMHEGRRRQRGTGQPHRRPSPLCSTGMPPTAAITSTSIICGRWFRRTFRTRRCLLSGRVARHRLRHRPRLQEAPGLAPLATPEARVQGPRRRVHGRLLEQQAAADRRELSLRRRSRSPGDSGAGRCGLVLNWRHHDRARRSATARPLQQVVSHFRAAINGMFAGVWANDGFGTTTHAAGFRVQGSVATVFTGNLGECTQTP